MRNTADVIIVGAGVAGCSVAFHLGTLGIRNVVLVEKEPAAGQGSTARANGGIRAQWSTPINIECSKYSIAAFERFGDETGGDCGLLQAGYLFMTASEPGEKGLSLNFALQQKLGVPNRWLAPEEISELAPYVRADDLRCGTYSPKDGFIDPHGTTEGYLRAAQRQGARLITGSQALEVIRDSQGVMGVRTTTGPIYSRAIVNAAGPFAGILAQRAGIEIPLRPYKRMLACSEETAGAARIIPMTVDLDTGLLIRREGTGILFAYSDPNDPSTFDTSFDPAFLETVSGKASHRFPFLSDARIHPRRCWAGLYPETPDHHAILGPVPELPGFFLAVGFGGHGIMHAPATGRAIAELIAWGQCRFLDISALRLERFREGNLIVETTVL